MLNAQQLIYWVSSKSLSSDKDGTRISKKNIITKFESFLAHFQKRNKL